MTSISHSEAPAQFRSAPSATPRNFALDRARSFLTLVVVLHHAVIPYTYFGHTDPKSWIGFDVVVTATDSFFMAMFFFLSGLFVWPSLAHKSTGDPFARSPAAARPAVRDRRCHRHSARILRDRAAEQSRSHLYGLLVEDRHGRAVAERPALVRLGAACFRSARRAVLYRLSPSWSIPSTGCRSNASTDPARFFMFLLVVTAIVYVPALIYFGPNSLVRVRAVLGAGEPHPAIRGLLLHRRRHRRREFRSGRAERRWPVG